MTKRCYFFGPDGADGDAKAKPLLGGKGANLAEMAKMGIPLPPGFTLTTEICLAFQRDKGVLEPETREEVLSSLRRVEALTDRTFGDASRPLLVSVRSGARASMPGMMDTILNLGMNEAITEGLARATNNGRFAYDAFRRFIAMYSDVVLGVPKHEFEELLEGPRRDVARTLGMRADSMSVDELRVRVPDHKIGEAALRDVASKSLALVEKHTGRPFPSDPETQLFDAIGAVFRSWDNDRAKTYRRMHDIPDGWGTACTVQAMVFGNLGDTSATGVCFTRDPRTGERRFFGEWLPNAQGEDVVAGVRTPLGITRARGGEDSLEARAPESFAELTRIYQSLEQHYRDMLDIEFTIQARQALVASDAATERRSDAAPPFALAVEMVNEGLITKNARQCCACRRGSSLPELLLAEARCERCQDGRVTRTSALRSGCGASPELRDRARLCSRRMIAERLAGQRAVRP